MSKMSITFIIIHFGNEERLVPLIRSIEYWAPKSQIIVVANETILKSSNPEFANVEIIKTKQNLGYGQACNLGAKSALGQILAFLNNDVIIKSDLEPVVSMMQKHSRVGVIGPKLLLQSGLLEQSIFRFPALRHVFWESIYLSQLLPTSRIFGNYHYGGDIWPEDAPRRVDWVKGAVLFVRREAFESVQGFDPRFFMYSEETDLCWRLYKEQWETWYVSQVRVEHAGAVSTSTRADFMRLELVKSRVILFRKHRGLWRALLARIMMGVGEFLRLAGAIILGRRQNKYQKSTLWLMLGIGKS